MRFDILSLFPSYFKGPFSESLISKAIEKGLIDIGLIDIRDFAKGRHRQVDDRPYGGGPGMVLMPEPVAKAIDSVKISKSRTIYLSPQGKQLNAQKARLLASEEHLILLCGQYEGVDERIIQTEIDEEISIGDYVLMSGCAAAIVLVESVARFIPGVIGDHQAVIEDSFENGILDYPHYTRPEVYEGMKVPEVLLSGNHKQIALWRNGQAMDKTRRVRPELVSKE